MAGSRSSNAFSAPNADTRAVSTAEADTLTRLRLELEQARREKEELQLKYAQSQIENAERQRQNGVLLEQLKEEKQYKPKWAKQADIIKRLTSQLQQEKKANQDNLGFTGKQLADKRPHYPEFNDTELRDVMQEYQRQRVGTDEDDDEEPMYGDEEIKDEPETAATPCTPRASPSSTNGSPTSSTETPFSTATPPSSASTAPSSAAESPASAQTAPSPGAGWSATAALRTSSSQSSSTPLFSQQTDTFAPRRKRKSAYVDDFDEEEHLQHELRRARLATEQKTRVAYPPYRPNQPLKTYPETFEYELVTGWHNKTLRPYAHPSDETPSELQMKVDRLLSDLSDITNGTWLTKFEKLSYTLDPPVCVAAKVLGEQTVWDTTNPGEYACHRCTGSRQPCFSWDGKGFKLLPLRPEYVINRFTIVGGQFDVGKWVGRRA